MILDGSSAITAVHYTVTIDKNADAVFIVYDRVYVGKLSGNEKISIRNLNELVYPSDLESRHFKFTQGRK